MDEENRGPRILITVWTLTGLSGLFLAVRLACKLWAKRRLWWDDYVLALSWFMLVGSIILVTMSVSLGLGKHSYLVPPQNFGTMGLIGNLTGTFSILAATWSKTSFALTLLRLMQGRMQYFLWFIIVTINIFMGLNAVFMWVRCAPVQKTWNPFAYGTCWDPQVYPNYGMFAAGYSAAMEFILALLPWKIIWGLQMKRKEKVGVALAMSMGIFGGATAVMKTIEIPLLANPDFTYVSAPLIIWGAAESGVTIMAASIPVLRTLFRDLNTISRKYYNNSSGSKTATTTRSGVMSRYGDPNANTVVVSAAIGPYTEDVMTSSSSSEKSPMRESYGQIMQSTEVMIAVEYRKGEEREGVARAL
ncbi:hypothetical protein QBC34DRAFT_199162 [Podospora aff. communis PSN243]|uniref:Rhodopsin domain-containing protein n=1 Tax=Podospora aff. communis PSN243 TaxID=3040156 RepID=A0AAV9G6W7_9PEZI|nr:hypothetical protein QBC34DRAFT_199162 [Podospora aff. communis PSN243]